MWYCILLPNTLFTVFFKKKLPVLLRLDNVRLSISMLAIVKVISELQSLKFIYFNVEMKIGSQQIFKVLVSGFKLDANPRSHMHMSWPKHE